VQVGDSKPRAFTPGLFEAVLIMGKGAPTCDNEGL
jgi:hypothetical protein